jgi:hypothetical protein
MMIGIGMPRTHNRIERMACLRQLPQRDSEAIALASADRRSDAGRECADNQREE